MQQVRCGKFTHILVWKIDRISCNLLDFATMYSELKNLGVIFVSKNEQFDTSSAMGEAMLKIILIFAELERNMTSERVTAAMLSRAANGQWNGGRIPMGYDYDPETKTFTVNESEAAAVRLIFDKYEQERSLVLLARYLNSYGYRTRTGCTFSPSTILIILYTMLASGTVEKAPFDSSAKVKKKPVVSDIELENLNTEKTRIERAVERLQNLYLYSDDSISQKDYIMQREKLMSQLADINEQIGIVMSRADQKDVSDAEFVQATSQFILTQKLEGQSYIYYKRLATTVSREVLRSFVMSIIENITIYNGKVQAIVFKNGLAHTFIAE